jgi:hypothetical protein
MGVQVEGAQPGPAEASGRRFEGQDGLGLGQDDIEAGLEQGGDSCAEAIEAFC